MTTPVAIITGGSRGLGAVLVRRFWQAGFSLAIVARNASDIRRVLSDLPVRDGQFATEYACDLADARQVEALVDVLCEKLPRLDVLVNNAAIHGAIGPFISNDLDEWRNAIQVNLIAPVTLCHGLATIIAESGGGSIINLSGGGSTSPRANFSAYATAKTGLVRFSETLAEELRLAQVRVNCIAPGAMQTDMLKEVLAIGEGAAGGREFALANKVFVEGGASTERVADLALFLATDVSKGISGKLISAVWDDWENWPLHLEELTSTDVYTLRRLTGRDRGFTWGDK